MNPTAIRAMRVLFLSALMVATSHSWSCSSTGTEMSLVKLSESNAVCNDGTQAGFYFKKGSDSKLWLIYLAGGDWCYDADSCAARALLPAVGNGGLNGTFHTSSSVWSDTCLKQGIFSEDDSAALKTANKIYIPYCTSDAHMGDRAASDATNGWNFRGQSVVKAVLSHAVSMLKMGSEDGSRLVFGGGSAGGRGAMVHLDFVESQVPSGLEALDIRPSKPTAMPMPMRLSLRTVA